MNVHLLDGTYELFRQFFGQPSRRSANNREIGAVRGVVLSVVGQLEQGVTHLGVATDHVIESFRNDLWPGYKDGSGVEAAIVEQFELLETALGALGVTVWPMTNYEADDALASAAAIAMRSRAVEQIFLCTPDKDLAQCVVGRRVVQLERRTGLVLDEEAIWAKYGVAPASIPDWLALVGDSADGFPGIKGWGKRSASAVLSHYASIDRIPKQAVHWDSELRAKVRGHERLARTLEEQWDLAELFRTLATLEATIELFDGPEQLEWRGPTSELGDIAELLREPGVLSRIDALARARR